MRPSIWLGLLKITLGVGFGYLALTLGQIVTFTQHQFTALFITVILFLLLSAVFFGIGGALVVHWLAGFAEHWTAFVSEIVLSIVAFFVGIIGAIISKHWTTGLHFFLACFIGSLALLFLSFTHLFGGVWTGVSETVKYVKKRVPWQKKKRA